MGMKTTASGTKMKEQQGGEECGDEMKGCW